MSEEVKIQIRFNDLDGYGHVNNSVYLSYLEVARCSAYASVFNKSIERKVWYILSEAQIKYRKFIKFDDEVYVRVRLDEARGAVFSFQYTIHNGKGTTFAEAKTVHAVFDAEAGRPVRVTQDIKSALEKRLKDQ